MNKLIKSQSGLTLIELLGAFVIMIIIAALAFPILGNGMKAAETIRIETMLRDEADYLMAAFIKELYTTKESDITAIAMPEPGSTNYYLTNKNGDTGFIDGKLYVAGSAINTTNNSITLSPTSKIELSMGKQGQYEVNLSLLLNGKEMNFQNFIRTINDKEGE